MSDITSTDVLIIGGGPTGLALACDLTRRGVACLLLERAARPAAASRAKTIQPRTLEVADDLGVIDRILELGATHVPTRLYDRDRVVSEKVEVAADATSPDAPYAPIWMSQPLLEGILRDRLAELGGRLEMGTQVTAVTQHHGGVTATVRTASGTRRVHARYAVGCDGGRSFVRQQIGVQLQGVSYTEHRWHLADVRVHGLEPGRQHLWTSPEHGILSLFPLPSTDIWQFQASIPADQADPPEPSLELLRHIFAERAAVPGVTITDADWLSLYRINVCLADRYRVDRVFLAGDAAHIHSPAGGQGMNTGVQDAYNLGWKLAAVLTGADAALLDTYEQERRPVAQAVLDDSTARLHAVMQAAGSSDGSSPHKGLTGDFTTGLTIGYPNSPLSQGPTAGGRAPDAPCKDASTRRTVRLFDLQRGPHWTLLSFGDHATDLPQATLPLRAYRITTDPSAAGPTTVIDIDGHAHRAYDALDGETVLIRPDGYIATRCPTHAVRDVLARALAPATAH
ncbi:FAD-dependent oxidoreductase [Actinomadura nitritigenes]|uniref:FAD-dependent oxidoreductase n=1 Tax=Actinomadura nitritigenes TaxID=134602 RepID=UPI003D921EFB